MSENVLSDMCIQLRIDHPAHLRSLAPSYKTFFIMLNSNELENVHATKSQITYNCKFSFAKHS